MNVTALTDLALAAAALIFTLLLLPGWPARSIWILGFFFASAAAAIGVAYHAGMHTRNLWSAIVILIGIAAVLFAVAAFAGGLPRGAARTQWIIAGAVVTGLGLGVQQSRLRGHDVVYHLVQIAALYLFYRGALLG